MEELVLGVNAQASEDVSEALTAVSVGSGTVRVYATPALIALMERASVAALAKCLRAEQTSVGVEVNVKHLAATPVGMRVQARAEVIAIEGRRVTFKVEAWDTREKIGEGTHTRVIVDTARFVERVEQKLSAEEKHV
jgi:predicted thioesterase